MADTQTMTTDTALETAPPVKKEVTTGQAHWTVGRRKSAVARIKMSLGSGEITINDIPLEQYYPQPLVRARLMAPLVRLERQASFDISIRVDGGGKMSQADAIAHGIARALIAYDITLRPELKKGTFLTRDARVKERKKYGLRRARKAPQYSKR